MIFVIATIALVVLLVLVKNIYIIQQSRAYVVERLGAFQSVWEVGLHFKIPFIERVAKKVSLKEQVMATSTVLTTERAMARSMDQIQIINEVLLSEASQEKSWFFCVQEGSKW